MGKSELISVQAELVLTLRNYEDWCSKCPSKLPGKRTPGESFLFVDTNGNTLFSGSDFMEATKRRSYPVKVYRTVNVCNSFYSHSPTEPEFETWINHIGALMQLHGIIANDKLLDDESWKHYFEEGLTPEQTLVAEFGSNWMNNTFKTK